jgi:hypothetical protein
VIPRFFRQHRSASLPLSLPPTTTIRMLALASVSRSHSDGASGRSPPRSFRRTPMCRPRATSARHVTTASMGFTLPFGLGSQSDDDYSDDDVPVSNVLGDGGSEDFATGVVAAVVRARRLVPVNCPHTGTIRSSVVPLASPQHHPHSAPIWEMENVCGGWLVRQCV